MVKQAAARPARGKDVDASDTGTVRVDPRGSSAAPTWDFSGRPSAAEGGRDSEAWSWTGPGDEGGAFDAGTVRVKPPTLNALPPQVRRPPYS